MFSITLNQLNLLNLHNFSPSDTSWMESINPPRIEFEVISHLQKISPIYEQSKILKLK